MRKNDPKFSEHFYKRILKIGCMAIVLVSVAVIPIMFFVLKGYVNKNIKSTENIHTQKTVTQIEDCLQQSSNIATYISDFTNIPISELSETNSYWHKKILEDNMDSYVTTCEFIAKIIIEDKSGNSYSSVKQLEDNCSEFVTNYKTCKIFMSPKPSWPYFLKLIFTSRTDRLNRVTVFLNTSYISQSIFEKDTYLIDSNHHIVLSNDASKQGVLVETLYGADKKTDLTEKDPLDSYFVSVEKLPNSDLSVVSFAPKKDYLPQIMLVFFLCIISIALLMSLIMVIFVRIISEIYKPIRNIAETFKYHIPFDEDKFVNEISYINYSISHTLEKNEQLNEDLPKLIETAKLSQARAVYSQISPHFIFNTLDNIKWQSVIELGAGNHIEHSIVLLNNIISECMQQKDMITTIAKEIELTKNYKDLMLNRYDNFFKIVWNVPDELKNALIIKLSLQPLIENSIMHSFDPSKEGQYVNITFFKDEEQNKITALISDNGKGIDPETLDSIRTSLLDHEPAQKHIGIKNIHIRYQILYGENYGITDIKSNSEGTQITLKIPYQTDLN